MNLFDPMHLAIGGHNFVMSQQNIWLDIFCGSSSTLFSAFVLSCTACYMLKNTLYMYINTDYTRCLAVSIMTAFKIQNSVSVEGMHNRQKDCSAFAHVKSRDKVNSVVCFGFIRAN